MFTVKEKPPFSDHLKVRSVLGTVMASLVWWDVREKTSRALNGGF